MPPVIKSIGLALLALLPSVVLSAPEPFSPIIPLGETECSRCDGYYLPGRVVPNQEISYTIHSDLPEVFLSHGVLYSTNPILAPFNTNKGLPVPEAMRTQRNNNFKTVDGGFEAFLFHISYGRDRSARLVVHVRNDGKNNVVVDPRQVIITDGIIGTVHEMESNLGRRVMEENWDRPLAAFEIEPGKSAVVAYSKMFGQSRNGPDSSSNVNCFGIVRVNVISRGDPAKLTVSTLAIPAEEDLSTLNQLAQAHLAVGAQSGESVLDFMTEPSGCALRRCAGVFGGFEWVGDPLTLNVDSLTTEPLIFQMGLPGTHAKGCEDARQTTDMLLHPPYTRPDSVGNYMIDHIVHLRLVNPTAETRKADIRFGKEKADIGLGYQILSGSNWMSDTDLRKAPVRTLWAGPKQNADLPDNTRSFFELDGGPVSLAPGESRCVSIRFMILGNSSLPFQIAVAKI